MVRKRADIVASVLLALLLNRPQAVLAENTAPPVPVSVPAQVAPAGGWAVISQALKSGITASQAYFFIETPDGPRRVPAFLISTAPEGAAEDGAHESFAAAKVRVEPGSSSVTFSALVIAAEGQASASPSSTVDFMREESGDGLPDTVRARLMERKEVLRSFDLQRSAQEESLSRLRADAEVIANLGRILELKDDLESAKSGAASVARDVEAWNGFIRAAHARPQPFNFVGRERQLVRLLNDITAASRAAETEEAARRSRSSSELQRKLAVVESTRFEKYDDLQEQLIELKKQRAQLEQSPAAAAQ